MYSPHFVFSSIIYKGYERTEVIATAFNKEDTIVVLTELESADASEDG